MRFTNSICTKLAAQPSRKKQKKPILSSKWPFFVQYPRFWRLCSTISPMCKDGCRVKRRPALCFPDKRPIVARIRPGGGRIRRRDTPSVQPGAILAVLQRLEQLLQEEALESCPHFAYLMAGTRIESLINRVMTESKSEPMNRPMNRGMHVDCEKLLASSAEEAPTVRERPAQSMKVVTRLRLMPDFS